MVRLRESLVLLHRWCTSCCS